MNINVIIQLIKVLLFKDQEQYGRVWKSLTVFCAFTPSLYSHRTNSAAAVIAIVLLFATFVYSVLVLRNFGRGLKDACKCILMLKMG